MYPSYFISPISCNGQECYLDTLFLYFVFIHSHLSVSVHLLFIFVALIYMFMWMCVAWFSSFNIFSQTQFFSCKDWEPSQTTRPWLNTLSLKGFVKATYCTTYIMTLSLFVFFFYYLFFLQQPLFLRNLVKLLFTIIMFVYKEICTGHV